MRGQHLIIVLFRLNRVISSDPLLASFFLVMLSHLTTIKTAVNSNVSQLQEISADFQKPQEKKKAATYGEELGPARNI